MAWYLIPTAIVAMWRLVRSIDGLRSALRLVRSVRAERQSGSMVDARFAINIKTDEQSFYVFGQKGPPVKGLCAGLTSQSKRSQQSREADG